MENKTRKNPLKIVWIVLGFLCLGLGTVGIVLPILPTVPFYMATLFCFAKSSKKLHDWFIETNLYKNYLDSFVQKKAMSFVIFLPENSNDKAWGTGTGGSRINGFNRKEAAEGTARCGRNDPAVLPEES